jgi:hypothetical protein
LCGHALFAKCNLDQKRKEKTPQTSQLKMSKPTEVVKTTSAGATIQNVYICRDFYF